MILDQYGREIRIPKLGFVPAQPKALPAKGKVIADAVSSITVQPDEDTALEECK